MWTQKHEDECEEKPELLSLEQPTVAPVNASTDTARQEAEGDRDDKRRRVDEPGSTNFNGCSRRSLDIELRAF